MKFSNVLFYIILPLIIFIAIAVAVYGRTLGSYFLADDFGEILYVSQIFAGNWHNLVSTLTGNYMNISTMSAYRPCLLLSMIFDYVLWGTNASGYFATNIVFLAGTAMWLYALLLELTASWNRLNSFCFALSAAALFISSPLHCESVSLVVGRVDIICAFFYLLSLWSFISSSRSNNRRLTILGVVSLWLALLTKEMAIGLPIVLSSMYLLFPSTIFKQSNDQTDQTAVESNILQNLKSVLRITAPAWLSCLFYLVIRYLALGTVLGGYTGSLGFSQFNHIIERWTDLDIIHRIIFPLSAASFSDQSIYPLLLTSIYAVLLIVVVIRAVTGSVPYAWLTLLVVWIVTSLLPVCQFWGLGNNLEGARFLFFLTIPIAVIPSLVMFAPMAFFQYCANTPNIKYADKIKVTELKVLGALGTALCLLIITQTQISKKNNIPWIHAGKQTKALLLEGQKLAQSLSSDQKVIVLGIPDKIEGAHVIYNGPTFNFMMNRPFSKDNYASRFVVFKPMFFGNSDRINTQRFKNELIQANVVGLYVWRKNKLIFEQLKKPEEEKLVGINKVLPIPLPLQKEIISPYTCGRGWWRPVENNLVVSDCKNGFGVLVKPIGLDPYVYDFMEMRATIDPPALADQLKIVLPANCLGMETERLPEVTCSSISPIVVPTETQIGSNTRQKLYRFALSRYWLWFNQRPLDSLIIEFPPARSIIINDIRFVSDNHVVPRIFPVNSHIDNIGVYTSGTKGFSLKIDSQVEDCPQTRLEISKPNYFFENLEPSSHLGILKDITISRLNGNVFINNKTFPMFGYYQIRAIALNKNGEPVGESSDPITIKFDNATM